MKQKGLSNNTTTTETILKQMIDIPLLIEGGLIISLLWFRYILFPNKKPDLLGILILADIIYWWKPTIVRNESTGEIVYLKKKFKGDKLQRSYQSYADQFGVSKKQVKEAMDRLEEKKLIKREWRKIFLDKVPFNNVLFLVPNPEKIRKITSSEGIPLEKPLSENENQEEITFFPSSNSKLIKNWDPSLHQREEGEEQIVNQEKNTPNPLILNNFFDPSYLQRGEGMTSKGGRIQRLQQRLQQRLLKK